MRALSRVEIVDAPLRSSRGPDVEVDSPAADRLLGLRERGRRRTDCAQVGGQPSALGLGQSPSELCATRYLAFVAFRERIGVVHSHPPGLVVVRELAKEIAAAASTASRHRKTARLPRRTKRARRRSRQAGPGLCARRVLAAANQHEEGSGTNESGALGVHGAGATIRETRPHQVAFRSVSRSARLED